MTNSIQNLPSEMQARLAQIMANAPELSASQLIEESVPKPKTKAPTLMDHVIALRQEVAQMRQDVQANSDVVEAVGQAVGQLYQMFQSQRQSVN